MFIKNPTTAGIINIDRYGEIRPCSINPTHVDFYIDPVPHDKERGKPDFTLIFDDQADRDAWFKKFSNRHTFI